MCTEVMPHEEVIHRTAQDFLVLSVHNEATSGASLKEGTHMSGLAWGPP
jgi:hypothetical protein